MLAETISSPPVVLLKIDGARGFSADELRRIYYSLLDQTTACLQVLPPSQFSFLTHGRFKSVDPEDSSNINSLHIIRRLLSQADLFISTNANVLEMAANTTTKTIGVWFEEDLMLRSAHPRREQANLVLRIPEASQSSQQRLLLNILDCFDRESLIKSLLQTSIRMLGGCRYLPSEDSGADAQLQQFILDWQGHSPTLFRSDTVETPIHTYNDRHRSFDMLFRLVSKRFVKPTIIETGCMREKDNFRGDGCSTLLFGRLAHIMGGRLFSVELNEKACEHARRECEPFKDTVQIICSDSVSWLRSQSLPISVLYLDSMDTFVRGSSLHGLAEIQAAYDNLVRDAIVIYDDTVLGHSGPLGKGCLGVPWLIERGWEVIYTGYQTVLQRQGVTIP